MVFQKKTGSCFQYSFLDLWFAAMQKQVLRDPRCFCIFCDEKGVSSKFCLQMWLELYSKADVGGPGEALRCKNHMRRDRTLHVEKLYKCRTPRNAWCVTWNSSVVPLGSRPCALILVYWVILLWPLCKTWDSEIQEASKTDQGTRIGQQLGPV